VDIDVVDLDLAAKKSTDVLAKSPAGKVPVLETPQGLLFESNAIARYIARARRDTDLYGVSFFDSGLVDAWIDFAAQEVELPATLWVYPVFGYLPHNAAVTEKAKADLGAAMEILDNHLADKTYLVGEKVTLADITVASALVYPYKIVMSPEYRAQYPHVLRWFLTIVNQPHFRAVTGDVVLAEKELVPSGAPPALALPAKGAGKKEKKEKKEKAAAPKQEKKKEEAPAKTGEDLEEQLAKEEKKKAAEHPLKILDRESPSEFVMDTWKKTYSNARSYDQAMDEFWKVFDSLGYSLWFCNYQYNSELTKLFMTCNLVSGFVQRTDELRKWAFGCMWILGEDAPGKMEIRGLWLMRGQSDSYIKSANPDAEFYTWTKVPTPVSDEDKKKVQEYWCSDDSLVGLPVLDCKVFK
jgi:elongation factor 1-gamma